MIKDLRHATPATELDDRHVEAGGHPVKDRPRNAEVQEHEPRPLRLPREGGTAMNIKPVDLPISGWHRVDTAQLWPGTLLPLLEASRDLQSALEAAVAYWVEDHLGGHGPADWRWDDPAHEAPFMLTRHDGAVLHVDERIEAALDAGDEDAVMHNALMTILIDGLELPEDVSAVLREKAHEIYARFVPQPDEILWVRPMGSCHWFVEFELALAKAWKPEASWQVASSKWHSTVIALEERLIFDLVLLVDEDDTDPDEPVKFVRGEGKAVARILGCRRANRNARARWRRYRLREQREANRTAVRLLFDAVPTDMTDDVDNLVTPRRDKIELLRRP